MALLTGEQQALLRSADPAQPSGSAVLDLVVHQPAAQQCISDHSARSPYISADW